MHQWVCADAAPGLTLTADRAGVGLVNCWDRSAPGVGSDDRGCAFFVVKRPCAKGPFCAMATPAGRKPWAGGRGSSGPFGRPPRPRTTPPNLAGSCTAASPVGRAPAEREGRDRHRLATRGSAKFAGDHGGTDAIPHHRFKHGPAGVGVAVPHGGGGGRLLSARTSSGSSSIARGWWPAWWLSAIACGVRRVLGPRTHEPEPFATRAGPPRGQDSPRGRFEDAHGPDGRSRRDVVQLPSLRVDGGGPKHQRIWWGNTHAARSRGQQFSSPVSLLLKQSRRQKHRASGAEHDSSPHVGSETPLPRAHPNARR